MKSAIFTSFDRTIPFDRAMAMVRAAGFEAVALDARHSDYATPEARSAIRKLLALHGMTIDSLHAPFPEGDRLFSLNESERQESIRLCRMALDAAAELDGRIVVLHLIQPYDIPHGERRDNMIEQGRRSVGVLAEHAARRGVKLALENGQRRDYDEVLESLLTEFDPAHVGFCYDVGHEHVQGACFRLLEQYGHRLLTVHIHDNAGSDTHVLPGEGTIDWARFRKVFHGLRYSGNLLLEADIGNSQFKDPAVFLAEAKKQADNLLGA